MKESASKASSTSSLKAKSAQKTAAANKRKIADLEAQVLTLEQFVLVLFSYSYFADSVPWKGCTTFIINFELIRFFTSS